MRVVQGPEIIKRYKSMNGCRCNPTQMALKAAVDTIFGCHAKPAYVLPDNKLKLKHRFASLAVCLFFNLA